MMEKLRKQPSYFNYVQPWQHHSNTPQDGINMYSFALNPEEHQPSGTCNMSRIDNATLNLEIKSGVDLTDAKLSIYALSYNVNYALKSYLPFVKRLSQWKNSKTPSLKFVASRILYILRCTLMREVPKAFNTTLTWKLVRGPRLIAVPNGNSSAFSEAVCRGNNLKDWVIRSREPKSATRRHKTMFCVSAMVMDIGSDSETERVQVFNDGFTNLKRLKIQSTPYSKDREYCDYVCYPAWLASLLQHSC